MAPSLLEKIVDKARLIADMLVKMQSRHKDSQLRNIENKAFFKDLGSAKKKNQSEAGDEEDYMSAARLRKYSSQEEQPLVERRDFNAGAKPSSFLQSIHAQMGGTPELGKTESKGRTVSDVDNSNLRAVQDNTSSMIDLTLMRMKGQKSGESPDPNASPVHRECCAMIEED
jgi:hypothetical protein